MTTTLNAIEVFEIAEQIERNGANFYRKAAELFNDSGICQIFLQLAGWEIKHEQVFADMKKQLVSSGYKSKTYESEKKELDPKLMASLAVFGTASEPLHRLKGIETITEALKTAIEKEKESITFYEGLKEFVSAAEDRGKVNNIINEELHHIDILNQALKQRE